MNTATLPPLKVAAFPGVELVRTYKLSFELFDVDNARTGRRLLIPRHCGWGPFGGPKGLLGPRRGLSENPRCRSHLAEVSGQWIAEQRASESPTKPVTDERNGCLSTRLPPLAGPTLRWESR